MKNFSLWLQRQRPSGRTVVIAVPFVGLLITLLLPFLLVLKISFAEALLGIPPYTPLMATADGAWTFTLRVNNYATLIGDWIYIDAYLNSLKVAATTTLLCLLVGYPIAYCIARAPQAQRNTLLIAVMLPFWTSSLIRVYAWVGILKSNGLLNQALMWLGVVDTPLMIYRTSLGAHIGMVYTYLPLMIMPLLTHLSKMNLSLLEAAYDLGAKPWHALVDITIPLSKNGIVAGCLLVFIPAVGEFVVPELLGGTETTMIGRVMWEDFFGNLDWPMASAVTVAMVTLLLVPVVFLQHYQNQLEAE